MFRYCFSVFQIAQWGHLLMGMFYGHYSKWELCSQIWAGFTGDWTLCPYMHHCQGFVHRRMRQCSWEWMMSTQSFKPFSGLLYISEFPIIGSYLKGRREGATKLRKVPTRKLLKCIPIDTLVSTVSQTLKSRNYSPEMHSQVEVVDMFYRLHVYCSHKLQCWRKKITMPKYLENPDMSHDLFPSPPPPPTEHSRRICYPWAGMSGVREDIEFITASVLNSQPPNVGKEYFLFKPLVWGIANEARTSWNDTIT